MITILYDSVKWIQLMGVTKTGGPKPFKIYNNVHNILRLFDLLPNFAFTTSETMRDYYI